MVFSSTTLYMQTIPYTT